MTCVTFLRMLILLVTYHDYNHYNHDYNHDYKTGLLKLRLCNEPICWINGSDLIRKKTDWSERKNKEN